ncbi:hypothetical protein TNCV_3978341 [Trichonephila clavipes]|nr:hypothetical protein TNCV_3978341 [Trichonephila clavipes]
MMVASIFGVIVVNAYRQSSFLIVIVTHHMVGWYGVSSRLLLVHTPGTLNSAHYISGVLRPVALTFIRALRNLMFRKENSRPYIAGIVWTFLDTENV